LPLLSLDSWEDAKQDVLKTGKEFKSIKNDIYISAYPSKLAATIRSEVVWAFDSQEKAEEAGNIPFHAC
jgi:hypothetical protein